jgi:biotin synthase
MAEDLLEGMVEAALERRAPQPRDCLALLARDDGATLAAVEAASRVRRHFFGGAVKLNFLINVKSGACPEDCGYCSQRRGSDAEVLRYAWLEAEEAAALADRAAAGGARRVCLVAAGRGPNDRDLSRVRDMIRAIRQRRPWLEVCVSLGLLRSAQAALLREAGASAYNHNLNTSQARYEEVCATHTYADRVGTLLEVAREGLSLCSGAIFGLGESDEDIVDLAFALRDLQPDSVPVNFLIPFEGTPLDGEWSLTPQRCLRILAMMRFVFPDVELRLAAGREIHLRSLQPLALHVADSIFLGDYLTSEGEEVERDLAMIGDAGLVVDGAARKRRPDDRPDLVVPRRRGPGTDAPANV